jgi:multicomponent Na+:H+ antiporter subunit B
MALLTLLAVVTVGIIRLRNLFGVVILASIYSFLMATLLVALDAVDVAMTEASVGAGISTVLLLAALHLTRTTEAPGKRRDLPALALALVIGAALVWGTLSLPSFGSAEAVIHFHVVPRYIGSTLRETLVPNVVTAVLADYRGYDTLGETTVIFTAGIGVMLLLRGLRRRDQGRGDPGLGAERHPGGNE